MNASSSRAAASGRHRAFSLVETTIAIGIVSTVVLALIGTMPPALSRLHRATVRSADARALESIVGIYQMRDWNEVTAREGIHRSDQFHFDRTGAEVPASDIWVAFVAAVTIEVSPILPGETTANPNLRKLTLELSDRVGKSDPFNDPKAVRKFTALLSRIDR